MTLGVDYAWASPKPSPDCLRQAGADFIMRYFSHDPAKDLTQAELDAAVAAGLTVGVVWETTSSRMLSGHAGGMDDARDADLMAVHLGMTGIPLYFACDFDATEAEQPLIDAYMDGVISIIGKARAGMYAGYYPLKRAWDAGKLSWGWQTYAWSGGLWDPRAQLRQVQNGVTVCGTPADWDESMTADFGQWPRPSPKPPSGGYMSSGPITALPPGNWQVATLQGTGADGRLYVAEWDGKKWRTVLWPVQQAP
jgi:hypothetical protein